MREEKTKVPEFFCTPPPCSPFSISRRENIIACEEERERRRRQKYWNFSTPYPPFSISSFFIIIIFKNYRREERYNYLRKGVRDGNESVEKTWKVRKRKFCSFVDLIKFEFSIIMFGGVTRGEIETKRLCWKDEVGQRGTDVGKASEI